MERLETIASVRDYVRDRRSRGHAVAFVPTMGALHDGHRSCVDVARGAGDVVVLSIFVNPTQFGPNEDLSRYPRPLGRDLDLCRRWGVDAVFVPDTRQMYPSSQDVWVDVERFSDPLCGRSRKGHFRGVATVVLKLFNIVQPDTAVFGQKDAQQAVVIREMVRQLDVPAAIVVSPTVREEDGLALSSRNAYLGAEERSRAAGIFRALMRGKSAVESGERDPAAVVREVRRSLDEGGIRDVEYVELVSAGDLSVPVEIGGRVLLALAARIGATRLIDNVCLDVRGDGGVSETVIF